MDELHSWEQVYFNASTADGIATLVDRFRVPGGWIYSTTILRKRWLGDETHTSTVFVPDPSA